MNTKFFNGKTAIVAILIILCLGVFMYGKYTTSKQGTEIIQTDTYNDVGTSTDAPTFNWRYEPDDSLNGDGRPQTNVYLDATYAGKKVSKLIATTPSGCNDLPDKESDSAPNSSVAQCYGAGYGQLFKVIKGDTEYQVMQKGFEESLPHQSSPAQKYKVVAKFPLFM